MEKKIVMAAGLFPPDIGGPATYAAMVAKRLPDHGFTVEVVPYGAVRLVAKWRRHLTYFWQLWRASRGADVVYALDGVSVGVPAFLVSRLRRIPLVVRLGGDYAWEQGAQRFGITDPLDVYTENRQEYALPVRMLARVQDFVVSRATLVILPSQYLRSIVTTWSGIKADRLQVVYSALFPLPAPPNRAQVREQLAYNRFTIFSAARLVPWKGMVTLVKVLANVPEAQLVIAGDGPEANKIRETTALLRVTDRVRLVGSLSKEALGSAIYGADVFAYNTAYEGLSHQLLEVMDLGVPIVTTNIGGNTELIEDGVSGRLLAPNDEVAFTEVIKSLMQNKDLGARYVQNARLRVADFTKEASVEHLASLLHKYVS